MTNWPFGRGDEGRKNTITAAVILFAFASLVFLGQSPQLAVALGFAATGLTAVLALPERKHRNNGTTDEDSSTLAGKRRDEGDEVERHPPSSHSRHAVAFDHYWRRRRLGRTNAA